MADKTSLIDRLKSIAERWEGGGGLCERDDVLEAVAELERQAQTIAELRAVVDAEKIALMNIVTLAHDTRAAAEAALAKEAGR